MIRLPLTWMAWSALSLAYSIIALGVQYFLSVISSRRKHSPGLGAGIESAEGTPAPDSAPFNFFQLAIFALAVVWSSFYVVMIHIELCRCKRALGRRPWRRDSGQIEAGRLRED
ncbi:hypothetical protein C8R43DRAFT_948806 [Mycena crocata]|nr:hypothetical protein C8R43DRAFT_948806 [Mycena crocata]